MAEKKTQTLSVRITPSLKERVLKAENRSGIPYPVLVVRAIESVCELVEKQGYIMFPLSIPTPAKKSK
ncbi:MAG TPA: hypothetical protein VK737_00450 [Opitutales bacterium]|jgi:hypothetical protein|nr:hypothetical protein [Opitutales bacterium]